jgi:hypothetical protein
MSTDDDCELMYEGRPYCFYNHDLRISKRFKTREEAIDHIKSVTVKPGGKASEWTEEWLADAIKSLRGGNDGEVFSGNQEYDIRVMEFNF